MRFSRTAILVVVVLACLATCWAKRPTSGKTLVLLDSIEIRYTHSVFFKSLAERGYQLVFSEATDSNLVLAEYGEYLYDSLIIFAPSVSEFGGRVNVPAILQFIDDGHDVLIAADSEISDPIHELASECGVEFAESGTFVIDHFNFDVTDFDGDHTLLVADDFIDSPIILGKPKTPVLFRGIAQDLDSDNELLIPILRGSSTSYSYSPDAPIREFPHTVGKGTVLVSALQARNNARVVFSGSLELFSDKFFSLPAQKYSATGKGARYERSGNQEFAVELSKWLFHERGVLRAKNPTHHRVGETETPATYRITDDVEYSVEIEEWNGEAWVPYSGTDVQLEFVRLDPYVRTFLRNHGNGKFSAQFKVPDVYGIYTFRVEYHRLGYTGLSLNTKVSVRPFRHNEYERFIPSAYPYYTGAISMLIGLFLFSVFFLYNRDSSK